MAISRESGQINSSWHLVGLIILSIRFVQGWIYWGGGSRRFIFDPAKLDPSSASYMAFKLQAAMPGALFDVDYVIGWLLQHYYLLFTAIILFSLAELIAGVCLILGLLTRTAALISVLISIALMIIFGWQGSTCMDEWTMAACTTAMGLTLLLSGAPAYSLDNYLSRKYQRLAKSKWFTILASGPINAAPLKKVAKVFIIFTLVFTLSTYNYYRGAVVSHYHRGPVDPRTHHIKMKTISYSAGQIHFSAFVSSGDMSSPAYIMKIQLTNIKGDIIKSWTGDILSTLNSKNIQNLFPYNQISVGDYGLIGKVGAKADITLPDKLYLDKGEYILTLFTIENIKASIHFPVS